jgi:hypothetical protein
MKPTGLEESLLPLTPSERWEMFHAPVEDWLLTLTPSFRLYRALLLSTVGAFAVAIALSAQDDVSVTPLKGRSYITKYKDPLPDN